MQFTQSISTLATELIDLNGLANNDYVLRGTTCAAGGSSVGAVDVCVHVYDGRRPHLEPNVRFYCTVHSVMRSSSTQCVPDASVGSLTIGCRYAATGILALTILLSMAYTHIMQRAVLEEGGGMVRDVVAIDFASAGKRLCVSDVSIVSVVAEGKS